MVLRVSVCVRRLLAFSLFVVGSCVLFVCWYLWLVVACVVLVGVVVDACVLLFVVCCVLSVEGYLLSGV